MAGNEEILLQFKADDQVTNAVRAMGTNVLNTVGSIQQAMSQLNTGLGNFAGSANMAGQSFGNEAFGQAPLLLTETANSAEGATSSLGNVKDATDEASKSNEKLSDSNKEVTSTADKSSDAFKGFGSGAKEAEGRVNDVRESLGKNTTEFNKNTPSVAKNKEEQRQLGNEQRNTSNSTDELGKSIENNTNLMTLSAGSAMYLAGQMSSLGTRMEDSAHHLNEQAVTLGQVAKMSGMAEGEMTDMIATISNETFPNDEALMYTKNLIQMGAESKNFAEQATNMDRINDAFGLGAETTNSLVTELSVLGVDVNNISESFNALAYANANTKGGMENYYAFLRKYDSELNELGYDVDQTSIIISAATQKYGGGRAALAGLSEALKDAGSDTKALESALGLKAGALEHAKQETSSYEGEVQNLADEEMEHKTWLDRIGAAWDDIAMKYSGGITMIQSAMGVFGQTANIGLTVWGLKEIGTGLVNIGAKSGLIQNTINRMKMLRGTTQNFPKINPNAMTPLEGAKVKVNPKAMTPVDLSKAPTGVGKGASQVAKETTQVAKAGTAVGAAGPEIASGAVAVEETAVATTTLSGAFTSMIVPLLAIAAVIAVMLPIIAGLVAEALLLIKGIQLVIKALNFDDIDLSSAIEGIKQVGEAIWEVGKAMLAMTFANLMTILGVVTGGIMGIISPLGVATDYLIRASTNLQKFGNVRIDRSIPNNIKNIAKSLDLISQAFTNLTKINLLSLGSTILGVLTKSIGLMTGDISDVVKQLIDASHELDKIKDIPDLDKGATDKLKKASEAIKAVGDAFEGLRKIRDGYNWDSLAGSILNEDFFKDIPTRLEQAKGDIVSASLALQNFNDVADIPDGVGDKLKKVADALKSVGDSIETLRKLRDDYNWDDLMSIFGGAGIAESLRSVKGDIWTVAGELQGMKDMPAIPKGTTDKLKKVASSLKSVLNAIESMKEIQKLATGKNDNDFSSIVATIKNARTAIYQVSSHMRALHDISAIKEGTEDKVKSVTKVIKDVVDAIKKMNDINGVSLNPTNLVKTFKDARTTIGTISEGLASYRNIANIPPGVADKVKAVKDTAKSVVDIIKKLNEIKGTSLDPTNLVKTFHDARTTIGTISTGLASYRNIANIPENVATKVEGVRKTSKKVVDAINTLNGLKPNTFDGSSLVTTFRTARSSIGKISVSLNSFRNIANIPENVAGKLSRVGSTSKKVATAIDGIKTVPHTNPDAENVKNAVSRIRKTINQLNKLKGKKVGNIGSILEKVKTAISDLKKALNESGDFKSVGTHIGTDLSGGVKTGLGGLSGVVTTEVTNAMRQGGSSAWTGGAVMATSAINGFKSAFLLSSVIATEMQNGLTAISSATPDLTNAMGALADQMVQEFKSKGGIASPGHVARAIRDEMGYTKNFVVTRGQGVIDSVGNLATSMVNTFNPNLQTRMSSEFNTGRLDSLSNMNTRSVSVPNNSQGNVTININEGAIQLDARNLSTQESRQIIVNAIEGLDVVRGVDVRGV